MPHISPKPLKDSVSKKLYETLFSALTNRNVPKKLQHEAFQELLTPTEKIMLAKRLVAVSLLSQGANPHHVGKTLALSPTTTSKLQIKIESGRFSNTKRLCSILKTGPLQHYLENLFKPLPRYGTGPASLFKER